MHKVFEFSNVLTRNPRGTCRSQFKRAEHLPSEKKKLVKEFLESFLITNELQQRFSVPK